MIRVTGTPGPADVLQTVTIPGKAPLHPGTEVTVRGLGRARYTGRVNRDGSLEVFRRGFRAATLDRVVQVHRKAKMR